jgi:RsiW-degrading membrane proteinase PrsW (M82 family)
VVCLGILAVARRGLQVEPVGIKKATRLDKEALAFLVTYALPLIAQGDDRTNLAALVVFVAVVGLVLVQLQILHVNPLLGILGYHFYEIERADGDSALVVSRSRHLPDVAALGQRLGPALWLLK